MSKKGDLIKALELYINSELSKREGIEVNSKVFPGVPLKNLEIKIDVEVHRPSEIVDTEKRRPQLQFGKGDLAVRMEVRQIPNPTYKIRRMGRGL